MSKSKLRKQFLTLFLAVAMAVTSVNLAPFGTVTAQAAESNELKAGKYYIKNVATGKFLNGGNDWGTQASTQSYGQLMDVEAVQVVSPEEGISTCNINSHIGDSSKNKLYLGFVNSEGNTYVDGTPTTLTLARCGDGIFTMANASGQYLTALDDTTVNYRADKTEAAEWRFITRDELMEEAVQNATEQNPADVTSLILDSGFGRNNTCFNNWKVAGEGYKDYFKGGDNSNQNVQVYDGVVDIYQVIEKVPNGVYRLSVQGFYREDGSGTPAVYYINGGEGELNTIETGAPNAQDSANGWTTSSGGKFVPNSPADASKCFGGGAYTNEFIEGTVTDHTLRVGVKTTNGTKWVCCDNFTLELVNADAEFVDRVEKKIDALGDVEITQEFVNMLEEAEAAYEALGDKKELVAADKVTKLENARKEFDEGFAAAGGSFDKLAADSVIAKIEAIGTVEPTDICKARIEDARNSYENLTDAQKEIVGEEAIKITNAENQFKILLDQKLANEVIEKIEKVEAIGTIELTDACKTIIEDARNAYDKLTDEQKEIVGEEEIKITNAENQFKALIPEQQVVANDRYYFVNTQTGGLLNGGNNWGTKASALSYGQLMTVKLLAGDTYHYNIQTHILGAGEYLTADAWTDQAAAPLVISKTANGTFTIANASGSYLSANDANTVVDFGNKTKYSEWLILTPKEYREKVLKDAKNELPVDVTTLIFDPNFGRNNTYFNSEWKITGTGYKDYKKDGVEANQNAQVYDGVVDVHQEIEVPNGVYELSVQGFYREDGSGTPAVYYINETQENLKSIDEDASTVQDDENGWTTKTKNGKFAPNNPADASKCFTGGAYVNKPIEVTVTTGKLRVGVKTTDVKKWVCWDNFTLKLLSVDDSEYVNPVIALIDAIGDVDDVALTDECKAKIDAAQDAFDALNETQQGKVTNAQALTDAVTRYKDLEAAAKVEAKMEAVGDYQFTTSYKNKMDAVKDEYDKLSAGAKDLVNKDTKDAFDAKYAQFAQDLIDKADELAENDAKEVTDLIDAIPALDEIKLADKEQIEAARDALDNLSELAASKISEETKAKLAAAEAKIKEIEEAEDLAAINGVISLIDAITEEDNNVEFTSDCRLAIEAAEKAYKDGLTDKQKTMMGERFAAKVTELTAARTAYDALVTENAPIIEDDDYYIVNKSTGKYLNANAQIKARVSSYGQPMTLAAEEDKVSYTVDSHYKVGTNDHYLTADGSLGGEATALKIENSKDGNINITNEKDEFLTANARGTVTFAAAKTEGSEWMILSRDELIDTLSEKITEDSPADVTSLIFDPGIDEKNEYYTKWSSSGADVVYRGDADNRNLEVYKGIFDFSQTIEDIPNGVYELTVQGFYRPENNNAVAPVCYANDAEGGLMIIDDGASTTKTGGWTKERPEGSGKYVPNSMEDTSKCFSTGAYTNEPVTVVVRDNTLKIGVKATDANSWVIWDNFQLKLKKVMTDADFAQEVADMIDAIGTVTATDECKNAIKKAQDAYEALTDAQKALLESNGKLEELEAKATEYEDITADPAVVEELKGQVSTAIADAEAEALDKEAYEADSWTAYDEALKALKTLSEKQDARKSEIEKALKAFKDASDGLVVKDTYKPSEEQTQNLATAVTDAAAVNAADYKQDENWTAFQAALKKAQEIQGRKNATAAQVQKAMADLDAAKAKLTPASQTNPADKTALDKAINDYKDLKEKDYTAATWKEFKAALDAAKAVSENPDATQQEVDDALAALNAKKGALKKPAPAVVKVKTVKVTADYTKLAAGKKATLKAAVTPKDAKNKKVKWTVDNKAQKGKYASINQKGVLTTKAKAAGKTITVTATAQDGSKKKGTIKIKVMKGGVKKITLKAKTKKVKVKKKLTIKATVKTTSKKAKDANTKLAWKSSNTKVATVNSKGVVTGKKAGKVTITATSTDGTKKSAKVKITVTKK